MNEMLKLEDIRDGMMRKRAIGNRYKQQTRDVYNMCSAYTTPSNLDLIMIQSLPCFSKFALLIIAYDGFSRIHNGNH